MPTPRLIPGFLLLVSTLFAQGESAGPGPSGTAPVQNTPAESAPSQQQTNSGVPPNRRWYEIPLPLIGTSSLPPQTPGSPIEPLTPKEKVVNSIERTVGPMALLNRGFLAGWNQLRNRPEEWGQGWDAYGHRYGYRMARLATRHSIMLGFDLLMHTDQRYDRCNCAGFWPRTGQAFKRVFVARTDSGGETFNAARVVGAYGAAAVTYRMYPDRYHNAGRTMNAGSEYLIWRGFSNVIREFWPEIHRVIRIGPKPSAKSVD